MSSSSITPSWAFLATGELCWVLTTMPSATVIVQLACGLGIGPPTHLHLDQALAAGAGRVEQGVVAEPRDDDARAARRRG
jgi:hypothetical protein